MISRGIVCAAVCLAFFASPAFAASLPTENIIIDTRKGPHKFHVEVADDPASQEKGLMFRRHLAADAGMIFPFPKPEMVIFWMKNTYIPLDILFVRSDGTVSSVAAHATPMSTTAIPSTEPILAVIELNAGRAAVLDIETGDRVHAKELAPRPRKH